MVYLKMWAEFSKKHRKYILLLILSLSRNLLGNIFYVLVELSRFFLHTVFYVMRKIIRTSLTHIQNIFILWFIWLYINEIANQYCVDSGYAYC